jgi:hypothetical protein
MTLDSDAWARREGWLEAYVDALGDEASHAGATKFPGGRVKRLWGRLTHQEAGPESRYIRPCHALYRREILSVHRLSFAPRQGEDGRWRTTGEGLHEDLTRLGHEPAFMPHALVERFVGHLRHATFVLNADRFPTLRRRVRRRGETQIQRLLRSREAAEILAGSQMP